MKEIKLIKDQIVLVDTEYYFKEFARLNQI